VGIFESERVNREKLSGDEMWTKKGFAFLVSRVNDLHVYKAVLTDFEDDVLLLRERLTTLRCVWQGRKIGF
jgi:hypothetical protein